MATIAGKQDSMAKRLTKETLFLRHNFTPEERLKMGDDLAAAYNRQEDIDAEEAVVKSQFKERRASVEQAISSLSRNLGNQFEMRNIECRIEYDVPNPNEMTYFRVDNGEVAKVRPLTEAERQAELPLEGDTLSVEESMHNATTFFGRGGDIEVVSAEELAAEVPVPDPNKPADVGRAKKNLLKM